MVSIVINTRADLDTIIGTPEHAAFMAMLRGTLWRAERDDIAQAWRAIEDNSIIEQFGFVRADFPDTAAPMLPVYVPPQDSVPQVVTMRQARLALLDAGLLGQIDAAIAGMPGPEGSAVRVEWEYAQEVRRDWPTVNALAAALSLDDTQLDELFRAAALL